jgi:hypothetical protein
MEERKLLMQVMNSFLFHQSSTSVINCHKKTEGFFCNDSQLEEETEIVINV